MLAVTQRGFLLEYASEKLKNNKDVVMAVVKKNGRALKYASEELKNDRDVVMVAVAENSNALNYASENLKDDKMVKESVRPICWETEGKSLWSFRQRNLIEFRI